MPRRKKQTQSVSVSEEAIPEPAVIEAPKSEPVVEANPTPATPIVPKVESVRQVNPPKPKRKCTEKQLAALAAGRAKNPRFKGKVN